MTILKWALIYLTIQIIGLNARIARNDQFVWEDLLHQLHDQIQSPIKNTICSPNNVGFQLISE